MAKNKSIKTSDYENLKISSDIKTTTEFKIHGMDDYYLGVSFRYSGRSNWNGAIPIQSKYQGINKPKNKIDITAWVEACYAILDPANYTNWKTKVDNFWDKKSASDTKTVFDALNGRLSDSTIWMCRKCGEVQKVNPQPAARIKRLKELGFFIATKKQRCNTCDSMQFFDILIRLPITPSGNNKRYSISKQLEKRIKDLLGNKDVCFDYTHNSSVLVIDHKFPSSRWINGETINEDKMTDDDIKKKFQLLTNQTNLQKERYCNKCVQDKVRGDFFGIKWYYAGNSNWEGTSTSDEKGCEGCCWYDMLLWKKHFNDVLRNLNK